VADLPNGRISYEVLNPQGKNVVLVFPGFYQSFHGFPPGLEPTLRNLDIQGIFLERPGVGISTLRPGLDLAGWAHLVEEFIKKVLNNQDVSIIGHSAGGPSVVVGRDGEDLESQIARDGQHFDAARHVRIWRFVA
jgi:pimeloyl-ACP methyl ester carboxylesterase